MGFRKKIIPTLEYRPFFIQKKSFCIRGLTGVLSITKKYSAGCSESGNSLTFDVLKYHAI